MKADESFPLLLFFEMVRNLLSFRPIGSLAFYTISSTACIVSCSTFLIIDNLAYFFHFSHYQGPYSSIWASVDSR